MEKGTGVTDEDTPNVDDDTHCRIGKCKPPQKCSTMPCYAVYSSVLACMVGTSAAFLSTQITSIEKQFGITSTTSGVLMTATEIGYLSTVFLTTHFCKRLHIPRVLGLSGLIYGLLAMLKSVMNFVQPVSLPKEASMAKDSNSFQYVCTENNSSSTEKTSFGLTTANHDVNWAVVVFGIIMALQGTVISSKGSLSLIYIDDNVSDRSQTAYYLGIITASSIFGPALALLLGGAFSRIPVDLKDSYLTPTDPRWVGAWWLGFIILGMLISLVAVPVICFPRRMPGSSVRVPLESSALTYQLKDLPFSLWRSLTKPIFFLALIARCIHLFAMMGQIAFAPKHLETQFNIPAYQANLMLGIANVVTTTIGTFLGGVITGRLRMNRSKCVILVLTVHGLGLIFNSLALVFGCDNTPMEGLDFTRHPGEILKISHSKLSNTTAEMPCFCDQTGFLPSCGEDGITYLNPCVAGCWNQSENIYSSCSRLGGQSVTPGICDNGCKYLYPYLVSLMLMSVAGTLGTIPHYMLLIRSVEERDKAISAALTDSSTQLLGSIPAPIVYGKVIDSACKVMAGSVGPVACSLYNIVDFRYKVFGMEVGLKGFALLLLVIVFVMCCLEERQNEKGTEEELSTEKGKEVSHAECKKITGE